MSFLTTFLKMGLVHLAKRSENNCRKKSELEPLSDDERVLRLERVRQEKGYKPGWLYHRCEEEGLLEAYNRFRQK